RAASRPDGKGQRRARQRIGYTRPRFTGVSRPARRGRQAVRVVKIAARAVMAKLILSMDGQVLKEIPLSKERITIGRKAHNDVQIDNLAVSGEHAVIVSVMDDAFLEDLGSTNGTVVNGKNVKKHFLQDNDVVELGKYKLKYVVEKKPQPKAAPAAPAAADFEKTMVLRPGAMKAAVEQARAMAAAGGQPAAAQALRA